MPGALQSASSSIAIKDSMRRPATKVEKTSVLMRNCLTENVLCIVLALTTPDQTE
jgi:hypothetical protein